jgi:hypothetical protein
VPAVISRWLRSPAGSNLISADRIARSAQSRRSTKHSNLVAQHQQPVHDLHAHRLRRTRILSGLINEYRYTA